MARRWILAVLMGLAGSGAEAASLKIVEIKASLFLEATGQFSEPLAEGAALHNLAKGDGPDKRLASGVLIDLTFSGDRNSEIGRAHV